MLNFKQIFCKSLALQCRNPFSTARVRNFFEIDPIFPDKHDPDKFLDIKRMSFHDVANEESRQRTAYIENALKLAKQRVPDIDAEKLEAERRRRMLSKKQRKEEKIKRLAGSILEDPDLKLPYGFGFDDYIQNLKMRNLSTSNDLFLSTLDDLFTKLEYKNDFELVQLHRSVVIEKTKDNFKERARAIVLDHLLKNLSDKSKGRRNLRRIVDDEQLLDSVSGRELSQAEIQELEANIDPQVIENAAENLADQAIDKTLSLHKAAREKQKNKSVEEEIQQALELTYNRGLKVDFLRDSKVLHDKFDFTPVAYPNEVIGMDDHQFKRFEMKIEAHDRFAMRRDEFIKELYIRKKNPHMGLPNRLGKKSRAKFLKQMKRDPEFSEKKNFFDELRGSIRIQNLEKKLEINDTVPRSFNDIYDGLDRVLENAPMSYKRVIAQSINKENENFKPQFSHLSINPDEFFWGRIGNHLAPIIPSRFIPGSAFASAPTMEEVLHPKLQTSYQKRKRRGPRSNAPKIKPQLEPKQEVQFDVSELTTDMKREIEIFRYVRNEPYFRHYLTNQLSYFTDRSNDQMAMAYAGLRDIETRPDDYHHFDKPVAEKVEKLVMKEALKEPILYNGKAFAGATRKKAKVLAIVKEGNGKVTINRKPLLEYFGTFSHRNAVIRPLMATGYSISVDVDYFMWGGGEHSQVEAGMLALSKALVKFNPAVKASLKKWNMLMPDPRQTERKHVGLYKARAKYPYQRR